MRARDAGTRAARAQERARLAMAGTRPAVTVAVRTMALTNVDGLEAERMAGSLRFSGVARCRKSPGAPVPVPSGYPHLGERVAPESAVRLAADGEQLHGAVRV